VIDGVELQDKSVIATRRRARARRALIGASQGGLNGARHADLELAAGRRARATDDRPLSCLRARRCPPDRARRSRAPGRAANTAAGDPSSRRARNRGCLPPKAEKEPRLLIRAPIPSSRAPLGESCVISSPGTRSCRSAESPEITLKSVVCRAFGPRIARLSPCATSDRRRARRETAEPPADPPAKREDRLGVLGSAASATRLISR